MPSNILPILPKTSGNIWRHFCFWHLGRKCYWHLESRTKDSTLHPTMHKTISYNKNWCSPNVSGAEVEKLCSMQSHLNSRLHAIGTKFTSLSLIWVSDTYIKFYLSYLNASKAPQTQIILKQTCGFSFLTWLSNLVFYLSKWYSPRNSGATLNTSLSSNLCSTSPWVNDLLSEYIFCLSMPFHLH